MLPALAGANLIYGLGLIELGMTIDYAQLVIDADIAKMVLFTLGGIPVNDQYLSVENIHQVGQFKDFLTHRSTFDFRKSQSQPAIIDRKSRTTWLEGGSQTMTEKAFQKAMWILENHHPAPLPESTRQKLREIVRKVEQEKNLPLSDS